MARRAWTLVTAGTALLWGWLVAGSLLFGENEPIGTVPLVLATLPLAAGALLTFAGGAAGARDGARRRERIPLWLAAAAGALELTAVLSSFALDLLGSPSSLYAIPLAMATLMLPSVAVWAAWARRSPTGTRPRTAGA